MIEDIGVEAYTAFPGHGRRFRIDADFLELAHVAPQLERADLEQVAEEHPALEPVLEAQPQLVVLFRPAFGDAMHLSPLLFHVAPPAFLSGYSQLSAPPVWYSITRVSKKLRSFFRSIISLIQGNGLAAPG